MRDTIVFLHDDFETPDTGSLRGDYDALATAVRASASRGEIRDGIDLELMIDLFAGPAVYRLLITGGDMSKMFSVDAQLDALMNGLAPERD